MVCARRIPPGSTRPDDQRFHNISPIAQVPKQNARVPRSQLDQELSVFHLQRVNLELEVGAVDRLSGFRIPLPSMPRADQLVALDRSLPQRTAAMQTHVVH